MTEEVLSAGDYPNGTDYWDAVYEAMMKARLSGITKRVVSGGGETECLIVPPQ